MSKVYLRKAEWKDVDLLFEWANDSEVRKNSFNTANIEYEEHKRWFENCIQDENIDVYICYLDADPIGQVRLNYNNETAVISYSIAKKYRGQGFGGVIIKLIEAEMVFTHPDITFLFGSVKMDNIASQRIFEDSGYDKELIDVENEHLNYRKRIDRKTLYTIEFINVEKNEKGEYSS